MSGQHKNVLMLAPSSWPQLGGVQTHIGKLSQELVLAGWQTKILVPPPDRPAGKLGLIWLWIWAIRHFRSFLSAEIIHIHDVFLWFWPIWPMVKIFNLFNQSKIKIITTFHGWEGTFPPSLWQKFNKWLAQHGSDSTVAVGDFISKFYPVKPTLVVYGGVETIQTVTPQKFNQDSGWIYLGRLEQDTGLPILLSAIEESNQKIEFWGDGLLASACQKYGSIKGWVPNPLVQLSQLKIKPHGIIAGGYLAVLEALSLGQRVIVISDNALKNAYYELAPFAKYLVIVHNASELKAELEKTPKDQNFSTQITEIQTKYSWIKLAENYLKLYESKN